MSETFDTRGGTTTFVVSAVHCAADHLRGARCAYRVAWSINPHMRVGAADPRRARAQHRALRDALVREGARLVDLPFVHGAYDSVFAKDNAVLAGGAGAQNAPRALLAN